MLFFDALLRWFFGLPPKARLLAAAQINLWVIASALLGGERGGAGCAIPLSADLRRQIRQQLEACATTIKLALLERAWAIAGVGSGLREADLIALARMPDLSAQDIPQQRLIVRLLQLLD